MNCVFLFGYLGSPPEYSISEDGVPSAKWSLAVRPRRGTAVNWVRCVCYRALADIIRDNYGTGDPMVVKDGELVISKWGDRPPYWQVRVRLIENLGRKSKDIENLYEEKNNGR